MTTSGWLTLAIVFGILAGVGFCCFIGVLEGKAQSYSYNSDDEKDDKITAEDVICTVGGLIIIPCAALAITFGSFYNKDMRAMSYSNVVYQHILTLHTGSEVNGSYYGAFTLGYGHIDSSDVYYFYVDLGDDRCQLKSLSNEDKEVIIDQSGSLTPQVRLEKESNKDEKYVIYVPEGTILEKYTIEQKGESKYDPSRR
jgi:hypothetical protein